MAHNLWLHFGVDEHPFATYFDVHQGDRVLTVSFASFQGSLLTHERGHQGFLAREPGALAEGPSKGWDSVGQTINFSVAQSRPFNLLFFHFGPLLVKAPKG